MKHYTLGYSAEMECTAPVFVIEGPDDDEYEVYLDNAENDDFKRKYQTSFYVAQRIFVKEAKPEDVDGRKGPLEALFENGWK